MLLTLSNDICEIHEFAYLLSKVDLIIKNATSKQLKDLYEFPKKKASLLNCP